MKSSKKPMKCSDISTRLDTLCKHQSIITDFLDPVALCVYENCKLIMMLIGIYIIIYHIPNDIIEEIMNIILVEKVLLRLVMFLIPLSLYTMN